MAHFTGPLPGRLLPPALDAGNVTMTSSFLRFKARSLHLRECLPVQDTIFPSIRLWGRRVPPLTEGRGESRRLGALSWKEQLRGKGKPRGGSSPTSASPGARF